MTNLLASVIVPTYNRADLLICCLESIRNQQYRPIEVLIIDDGSTDNTTEKVLEWTQQNAQPNFDVLYFSKANGGPSSARNLGLIHASGEYIYFFDSDDYMHEDLLAKAVSVLESESSDCVLFGFDCDYATGGVKRYLPPAQSALKSFLEGALWGYTPSSLKRASLVQLTGTWSEHQKIGEDYEYLGRSLFNASKVSVLQESLLTVRQSHSSLGDQKDTAMGLGHRLAAERSIVEQLQEHQNKVSPSWLSAYSSRLFKTAINMYAKGEVDFAKQIGLLSLQTGATPRRWRDKLARLAWRMGRWPSLAWFALTKSYSVFRL